jgi:enamine deaminase RidA (YjgF/YER057c/UK114 family)
VQKKQLYADPEKLVSAGVLAVPRPRSLPRFFFSSLAHGYDPNEKEMGMPITLKGQVAVALRNIDIALRQTDSGPAAITRLTIFIKDQGQDNAYAAATEAAEAIQEFFSFARPGNMILPAQSIVFVNRLPYDYLGQLVGIEATAIID